MIDATSASSALRAALEDVNERWSNLERGWQATVLGSLVVAGHTLLAAV